MTASRYEIGEQVTGPAGDKYELIERKAHVRRDGAASEILTWRGACRVCGKPFQCHSGPNPRGLTVHCPEHKLSKADSVRNWLAALNTPEARRKSMDTMRRKRELKALM